MDAATINILEIIYFTSFFIGFAALVAYLIIDYIRFKKAWNRKKNER